MLTHASLSQQRLAVALARDSTNFNTMTSMGRASGSDFEFLINILEFKALSMSATAEGCDVE
jgi:hypothetical protein